MNKKYCLLMTNSQICFLICILLMAYTEDYPLQDVFREYFFPIFSIVFVLLSPFGVLSAFFSLGIRMMFRKRLMAYEDIDRLDKNPILRFIVWDEVLAELREDQNDG